MELFGKKKIALGMVQPPPLPGSYLYDGRGMGAILDYTLNEAGTLQKYGFDGYILQNFADGPVKQQCGPETVACMTALATRLKAAFPEMVQGILVNWDGVASLAVAEAAGSDFVRVEHVYTRPEMTLCGLIEGQCVEVLELKKKLGSKMPIYADIYEFHGTPAYPIPLPQNAFETVTGAHADGLLLSAPTPEKSIEYAQSVRGLVEVPLILGGGTTGDNVYELLQHYDGVCVGAWIKNGSLQNPVDPERANRYMAEVERARA